MMPLSDWMTRKIRWDDFRRRATWRYRFCWWPQRCFVSNRSIWLKRAVQGQVVWTGPGDPILEQHWLDKDEYIIGKIKGDL